MFYIVVIKLLSVYVCGGYVCGRGVCVCTTKALAFALTLAWLGSGKSQLKVKPTPRRGSSHCCRSCSWSIKVCCMQHNSSSSSTAAAAATTMPWLECSYLPAPLPGEYAIKCGAYYNKMWQHRAQLTNAARWGSSSSSSSSNNSNGSNIDNRKRQRS